MFIRNAFNYDRDAVSRETGTACDPATGRTQQQFKEECDIRTIVKRFGLTGKVPVGFRMPESGDFTGAGDFHASMNYISAAKQEFLKVPQEIRRRFDEDPMRFVAWLEDPASREEATKLGFFKEPDVPRAPEAPKA